MVGAVLASIFPHPPLSSFNLRLAVVIFACFTLSFLNLPLVSASTLSRRISLKQARGGLYSPAADVMVSFMVQLPLCALETVILGSGIYYGVSFSMDAGRWSFFFASLFLADTAMCSLFSALPNLLPGSLSESLAAPLTGCALLFSGFLATRAQIPPWLTPLYYCSPFSWLLQSVAISEFTSSGYTVAPPGLSDTTFSEIYLNVFEFRRDWVWAWAGLAFNAAFTIALTAASMGALSLSASGSGVGFRWVLARINSAAPSPTPSKSSTSLSRVTDPPSSTTTILKPSSPSPQSFVRGPTVFFSNITYSIPPPQNWFLFVKSLLLASPNSSSTQRLQLLRSVSGRAFPGTLTAILGASGAGKSTLLDVLLGVKTQGISSGTLLVSGSPYKNLRASPFTTGYVQQSDLHEPTATVFEALQFSSALRSPLENQQNRNEMIDFVLQSLNLSHTRVRLVGGLSRSELKRLTIAIELLACPSVLFLDEPTTGLDSSEAASLVTVLKDIAERCGTTIIATIHSPSALVYALFHRAVYLGPGGWTAWDGEVGDEGPGFGSILRALKDGGGGKDRKELAETLQVTLPVGKSAPSWVLESLEILGDGVAKEEFIRASSSFPSQGSHYHDLGVGAAAPDNAVESPPLSRRTQPSLCSQLSVLFPRTLRASYRGISRHPARFLALGVLSCFFGALFTRLARDTAGAVETAISVWWMALVLQGIVVFATSLPWAFNGRAVVARECRVSSMYQPCLAAGVTLLVEVPWVVACATLSTVIIFPIVSGPNSLQSSPWTFCVFWGACSLFSLCCNFLAFALAFAIPTLPFAQTVGYMIQAVILLFGGLLVPQPSVPSGWAWLLTASPLYHAAKAVWVSFFLCSYNPSAPIGTCRTFVQVPVPSPIIESDFVVGWLGLQGTSASEELYTLLIFVACYLVSVILAAQFISHVKR